MKTFIAVIVVVIAVIWFGWSRPGVELGPGTVVEKLHTPASTDTGIGMSGGKDSQPTVVVINTSEKRALVVKVQNRHIVLDVNETMYYSTELGQTVYIHEFWWGYTFRK